MNLNRNKTILFTILMHWRDGKRRRENKRRKKGFQNLTPEKILFYFNLKVLDSWSLGLQKWDFKEDCRRRKG